VDVQSGESEKEEVTGAGIGVIHVFWAHLSQPVQRH